MIACQEISCLIAIIEHLKTIHDVHLVIILFILFTKTDIDKLTEDKKEGLRQLAMTFQHFMREEIQDASQLPPSFDLFEAFAKVSLKICLSFSAVNQSYALCHL